MSSTGSNSVPFGSAIPVADQIHAARTNKDPQAHTCCQWVLEGIVEFDWHKSTRAKACSGEPRYVDAKATYPENKNPT